MPNRTEQLTSLLDSRGASLHALLNRLTLRRDVADDLLQDLFLKLQRAAWLPHGDRLAAYARTTAIRLAMDWHRQQRRTTGRIRPLMDDAAGQPPAQTASLELAEDRQALLEALAKLSRLSREAIILRYLEERPFEDVANQLGKSVHQARAHCAKGLRALRRELSSHGSISLGTQTQEARHDR